MRRETPERAAAADAAYERGWVDSLSAYHGITCQPMDDRFWYAKGWDACAKYRWEDPSRRGVAADRDYRAPRQ